MLTGSGRTAEQEGLVVLKKGEQVIVAVGGEVGRV